MILLFSSEKTKTAEEAYVHNWVSGYYYPNFGKCLSDLTSFGFSIAKEWPPGCGPGPLGVQFDT